MSLEIRVPGLGAAMTEGTLVEWHKENGANISPGDILYTLESEKTVLEIEAQGAGTLRRIGEAGKAYPVGELIGMLEE